MKKLNIASIIVLCLFAFMSCDNEGDRLLLGDESNYVKPIFTQNIPQDFVVDKNTDLTKEIGSWTWTKADYGVESPVTYIIEMATKENFEDVKTLTSTTDNKVAITYELINGGASEYATESGAITRYFRLKSRLGATDNHLTFYSAYPKEVFMIGADFGNWEWSSDDIVSMIPVNGRLGEFWCVRYFNANNGFKWAPVKDWKGDYNSLGTNVGYKIDGGNAVVETSGFYSVYIDYGKKTITIEPAKVYGIGNAFGGWDMGAFPFDADGKTMKLKATVTTNELRMYVNSSASSIDGDWWRMEFIVRNGKIEYRGTGDDQNPRVPINAGQTVTLDFNAGTGKIE